MIDFVDGASCLAAAAIALFFVRFWRASDDRLFGLFALAFALLAVNRVALALLDNDSEGATVVYLARALAFALILVAIADKNLARRQPRRVHR